jgi:aminoglycoside 6'-N-acetyltransferase
MTGYLFESLDAQRVTIDPHVSNHRAVRCYEKAGFRKVRLLPRQELHEGEYWDCWLMVAEPGEG